MSPVKPGMFKPPCIDPPETITQSLGMLRDTMDCMIRTWPRAMYEDDVYEGPGNVLYVMNPQMIHDVLVAKAEQFPQSRILQRILDPVWREGIAASNGARWRDQRKAAAPAYTPHSSNAVVPAASAAAARMINRLEAQCAPGREGHSELVSGFSRAAADILLETLFDGLVSEDEADELHQWGEMLSGQMAQLNYADLLRMPNWMRRFMGPTLRKPMNKVHEIADAALARGAGTRTDPDTLVGMLQQAATDDVDGANMVRNNLVGSVIAGRENTALGMGWAIYMAAQSADLQDRLVAEIVDVCGDDDIHESHIPQLALLQSHYMETLRLFPPAPQVARDCTADTQIGTGDKTYQVKAGTFVAVPIYAVQRHRCAWDHPDHFDVERFLPVNFDRTKARYAYMPFGAGQRICMGASMANNETIVMLASLLRAFRFTAPPFDPADLIVAASLRPRHGLNVTYTLR